jgi:hypothetical protein
MSWSPCPDPVPGDRASADAIEMLIIPRAVDLGEMQVDAPSPQLSARLSPSFSPARPTPRLPGPGVRSRRDSSSTAQQEPRTRRLCAPNLIHGYKPGSVAHRDS